MNFCRNPIGRTGLAGRGKLGRFGPNHAADPIVTRWERDESGEVITIDGKPVLEFVAVKREDETKAWAIPGVSITIIFWGGKGDWMCYVDTFAETFACVAWYD